MVEWMDATAAREALLATWREVDHLQRTLDDVERQQRLDVALVMSTSKAEVDAARRDQHEAQSRAAAAIHELHMVRRLGVDFSPCLEGG